MHTLCNRYYWKYIINIERKCVSRVGSPTVERYPNVFSTFVMHMIQYEVKNVKWETLPQGLYSAIYEHWIIAIFVHCQGIEHL